MPSNSVQAATPVTQLYALLTGDEDARACSEIPEAACREQPASFVTHLISSLATKAGDQLASAKVTLAWLLAAMGAPAFMTGLLVPIRESGALLPQLVVAGYLRRLPLRKWLWVGGSAMQGLSLIGMAAVAATLDGAAAGWAVIALLTLFSLARGVCSVAHKDVLGKTIDRARRGTVMGYAAALGGIVTLTVGIYLAGARDDSASEGLFMLLLGGAGTLWLFAAIAFATLREQPGATSGGANALAAALDSLSIVKRDAAFRHFVITRALLLASGLSIPFYVALAAEHAGVSASGLGMFLVATGVANTVTGPLWGRLADHSSRKAMIAAATIVGVLGVMVSALAAAGASMLDHELTFALLFFVLAVAQSGTDLARKTYMLDLATAETRATYAAVSNTLIGVLVLASGAFGLVAQALGASAAILVLAIVALFGGLTALRLPEANG